MPVIHNHLRNRTPTTEAEATGTLQELFYRGVGKKFLGWQVAIEELQGDGTWKKLGTDGWRHWNVPTDPKEYRKWRPFHDHLKGLNRGVVSTGNLYVPFITVDPDRHDASIDPDHHLTRVLRIGQLLRKCFPQLVWLAEINPRNGSTKFFGYARGPIPIAEAESVAERIHTLLLENGCGAVNYRGQSDIEVFPHNCSQVGLPMRTGKVTVVSSGVLGKCSRKRRPEKGEPMVEYETYSALGYWQEIKARVGYDEQTLSREVQKGCASLPYLPKTEIVVKKHSVPKNKNNEVPRFSGNVPKASDNYRDDPNSFTRQQGAMLELSRKLGRVASLEEGLQFIRGNRLFTGEWSDNENRREDRVTYLLDSVSQTFDPNKCRRSDDASDISNINLGKYDNWAQSFVGGEIRGIKKRVDEYGNIVERHGVTIDWKVVSIFLSLAEYCCVVNRNDDGTVPQIWAERIWRVLCDSGRISVKWDDRKWKTARDWLERRGVIKIVDRNWWFGQGNGQAMKWAVANDFDRLHVWWRSVRESSGDEAVALDVFLLSMRDTHPLNAYTQQANHKSPSGASDRASRSPPIQLLE
jgi:hypothetical protein